MRRFTCPSPSSLAALRAHAAAAFGPAPCAAACAPAGVRGKGPVLEDEGSERVRGRAVGTQRKGTASLVATQAAVGTQGDRCLKEERQRRVKERQCLSHTGSGNARNGAVLDVWRRMTGRVKKRQ